MFNLLHVETTDYPITFKKASAMPGDCCVAQETGRHFEKKVLGKSNLIISGRTVEQVWVLQKKGDPAVTLTVYCDLLKNVQS